MAHRAVIVVFARVKRSGKVRAQYRFFPYARAKLRTFAKWQQARFTRLWSRPGWLRARSPGWKRTAARMARWGNA